MVFLVTDEGVIPHAIMLCIKSTTCRFAAGLMVQNETHTQPAVPAVYEFFYISEEES